jgi:hypothetical protein
VSTTAKVALYQDATKSWGLIQGSYTQKLWMRVKSKAAYLPG